MVPVRSGSSSCGSWNMVQFNLSSGLPAPVPLTSFMVISNPPPSQTDPKLPNLTPDWFQIDANLYEQIQQIKFGPKLIPNLYQADTLKLGLPRQRCGPGFPFVPGPAPLACPQRPFPWPGHAAAIVLPWYVAWQHMSRHTEQ